MKPIFKKGRGGEIDFSNLKSEDWKRFRRGNYKIIIENKMNGIFQLDWDNIRSAITSVLLTAVLGLLMYVVGVGDVWKIDFHSVVNIFSIAIATGLVSLIKNFLTTDKGQFLGVTQVIPPTN